jgi:hypothetical protein
MEAIEYVAYGAIAGCFVAYTSFFLWVRLDRRSKPR